MKFKKLIMNSMLFSAALGMIAVPTSASAKYQHYHYKYSRYTHRLGHYIKHGNQYGEWKRSRKGHLYWHKYKTGYFHNGKWRLYKYYAHYIKDVKANNKLTKIRIAAITDCFKKNQKKVNSHHTNRKSNNGLKLDNGFLEPASKYAAKKFATQIQQRTITDINKDRAANGLNPLSESSQLDKLAEMRVADPNEAVTHKNAQGQNYATLDAEKLGYSPSIWDAENIACDSFGTGLIGNQYNRNEKDIADDINNGFMNHDANSYWGHRDNILNTRDTSVGVGVKYDPSSDNFNLAEDFGQPGSAADQRASITGDYSHDKPVSTMANNNSITKTYGNGTQITTSVSDN